jgi:hypothetical protein
MNRVGRVVSFLLSFSVSVGISSRILIAQDVDRANQKTIITDDNGKELRDVFLAKETGSSPSQRMVGRLGILLATTGESFKQVRPDYSFRSGDHFRFEVTANQNGWLYVLHATPGGKLKQLWPRTQDDNAIKSGITYEIPPRPGIFIFDAQVGQEYFYIAIRSNQTPPKLDVLMPTGRAASQSKRVATAPTKTGGADITNFVIRDPFGETGRGVVFDPGKEDSDPYLYFSAVAKDNLSSAMIEFRLSHVE